MKRILLVLSLLLAAIFSASTPVFAAVTWTETQPAGDVSVSWLSSAISLDGQTLLVTNGTRLYISRNGGTNWSETRPLGDTDASWVAVGMSADRQQMIAAVQNGGIYISSNGGGSWYESTPGGANAHWDNVVISSNGRVMMAISDVRLYLSTDGGTSWTEAQPVGNNDENWQLIAVSGDGNTLLAGVYDGRLYLSTNRGKTWVETRPEGDAAWSWTPAAISNDGRVMVVGIQNDNMFISTDHGQTWSLDDPLGNEFVDWYRMAMSDDGKKIAVAGYGDNVYLSTDSGTSWTMINPTGDTAETWINLSMSADGQAMLASYEDGRMFLVRHPVPVPTPQPTACGASAPSSAPDLFQIDTTSSKAKLYFTPVANNTDKYVISYGYTPGDMRFGAELSGNSTGVMSYTVNELAPNSTYYVSVRAGNGCATGDWSNEMKITTASKGSTSGTEFYESFASRIIGSIEHLISF